MHIWEAFPDVAQRVRATHEEVQLYGHHDWQHAFRVGNLAYHIAMQEWSDSQTARRAGIAGLCHNADRVITKRDGVGAQAPHAVYALIREWLLDDIALPSIELIVDAVIKHSCKNADDDTNVLIALMDADRVVNLDVDLFARSGQHYHELPVLDYRYLLGNPEATYRNPMSVFRDIAYSLDWMNPDTDVCIRTKAGRQLGAKRIAIFEANLTALRDQLTEEGIYPYPF